MAEGLCVKEAGCGRSMSVALCGYDEDPVFFVDVCVCVRARVCVCVCACSIVFPSPKQSHPPQTRITDAPDARARRPRLRGGSQLYVNAAICWAAAPLPLWAAAGLPVWPPEGVSSKWAGNSVLTDQGPAPSLQDEWGKGAPRALQKLLSIPGPPQGKLVRADVPALWS